MSQYILDNIQWIFSGIGVLAISAVFWFFKHEKKGAIIPTNELNQTISASPSSTNIQTGHDSTVQIITNHTVKEPENHNPIPITINTEGAYIYKTRILEGEYQEIVWGERTVRISIVKIMKSEHSSYRGNSNCAEIRFDTGGGLVYGGEGCKKTDVNCYIISEKYSNYEEEFSAYAFRVDPTLRLFSFFRIFVDHINELNRQVCLNLFFTGVRDVKAV